MAANSNVNLYGDVWAASGTQADASPLVAATVVCEILDVDATTVEVAAADQTISLTNAGAAKTALLSHIGAEGGLSKSYSGLDRGERPQLDGFDLAPGAGLTNFRYTVLYRVIP